MRLKRVHIKNFRAIRDVAINLGAQTAFLGANGAGKSTVLRAIDRFYSASPSIELDDFFARNTNEPIEIALTFTGFSETERDLFASRISNDEMTVVRIFEAAGGRNSGKYYGLTLQNPHFGEIRNAAGNNPKRDAYNRIREHPYFGGQLQGVRRADEIEPLLAQWETDHPEDSQLSRDDGQFFGFSNVGRGNLQKSTAFVFIPAVRDASADSVDSRGAVIARLMELVVRSAVQRRAEIRAFQAQVAERYRELTNPEQLHELGDLAGELTNTLRFFYGSAGVDLRWKASDDLTLPLPTADVQLDDDGFVGPVDRKGHGLQRAFILTLLQHLAKAVATETPEEPVEQQDVAAAPPVQPVMPGLILAIEEPELYQHPTKQRHFSKVLSQLSDGSLPGVARETQVLFASHSSLFISTDRFEEVRLARRQALDPEHKECRIVQSTLAQIARDLETAWERDPGTFTATSLRNKLHIINSEVAEGFFAEKVVLVEGISDKAAIYAAAKLNGLDLEAHGIAVLPVDGKSKLDRPAAVFRSLGIPLFVVWDCDQTPGGVEKVDTNRALQRLMGRNAGDIFDAATFVGTNFACFESELEITLKAEIGDALFNQKLDEVKAEFLVERREDAQKAPIIMSRVLTDIADAGRRSRTLDEIIAAIRTAG